ncbi:MAG: hypothetical protein A2046_11190 [Bacteroidetes bacterium GWA2_30_7]|nr:MAG: hypothetical protein A2046_11190 [Bacteroidetes bacterium GWA2_30_7]
MRKLNKTLSLSAEFSKWYAKNKTKEYNSTSNKFYYDVLYELLIIQDGLCAYTEFRLIDEPSLEKIKDGFKKGKYSIDYFPDNPATIEHFSKTKKKNSGWDWDNLFAVFGDINIQKNHLENKYGIEDILKPDKAEYNNLKCLMYNKSLHIFFPNSWLTNALQNKVANMIIVLGLNNDFIKMKRREYLSEIKDKEYYLDKKQPVNQFLTAYSMI